MWTAKDQIALFFGIGQMDGEFIDRVIDEHDLELDGALIQDALNAVDKPDEVGNEIIYRLLTDAMHKTAREVGMNWDEECAFVEDHEIYTNAADSHLSLQMPDGYTEDYATDAAGYHRAAEAWLLDYRNNPVRTIAAAAS